jgi:hypothetical protein
MLTSSHIELALVAVIGAIAFALAMRSRPRGQLAPRRHRSRMNPRHAS